MLLDIETLTPKEMGAKGRYEGSFKEPALASVALDATWTDAVQILSLQLLHRSAGF
jgi:hypothetical protein